jgi:hypothetical protein
VIEKDLPGGFIAPGQAVVLGAVPALGREVSGLVDVSDEPWLGGMPPKLFAGLFS